MTTKVTISAHCNETREIKWLVWNETGVPTDTSMEQGTLQSGQTKEIILFGTLVCAIGEVDKENSEPVVRDLDPVSEPQPQSQPQQPGPTP